MFNINLAQLDSHCGCGTRGGEVDLSGGMAFTSSDVIQAFTTDKLLEMLTTRIDPEKSADVHLTMGFKFVDTNERYALEIRRGVAQFSFSYFDERVGAINLIVR